MTLEKAIDNLAEERDFEKGQGNEEMVDSIKLGIEALKFYEGARETIEAYSGILLPGETKD